ncbi:MAG TPA: DUF2073 domain-containing protein [Candidatus Nanoarchaeia archaeon]|nr:DUF2073 domain-containing protein [Candidatus Nanoarchaeia archaeon]
MLTLQYLPHHEFAYLEIDDKLKRILKAVKEDKILIIEGRLKPLEESELIKRTMEEINKKFKGIEIASFDYDFKNLELWDKVKKNLAYMLLRRRSGLTIVGPATVVREIKKDPNKIELFTMDKKRK